MDFPVNQRQAQCAESSAPSARALRALYTSYIRISVYLLYLPLLLYLSLFIAHEGRASAPENPTGAGVDEGASERAPPLYYTTSISFSLPPPCLPFTPLFSASRRTLVPSRACCCSCSFLPRAASSFLALRIYIRTRICITIYNIGIYASSQRVKSCAGARQSWRSVSRATVM